ncbi:hypothetical protein RD792_001365 [Penstemon davidsonii]|uniref:Salicylate carboxymethyltransferase n=1 Tax=Penstemon davidsonii TaxID=160366 RepID=A0ABR0DN64_9LAMI|nr:hypothetical protein RD792_001365 [Penstemon davidsonii]
MTELYNSMQPMSIISIADLGCSSGPNTLFVAAELVKLVGELCRGSDHMPEFEILLNDLQGNDFNSIFRSLLPRFQEELRPGGFGHCFVYGVPGSFYGRLFAAKSLHFVHSSYSLMWLSKVPEGLEMNKENIYMSSTSPKSVLNAYYEQFKRDFWEFLKCRSQEIVGGGKMVLTFLGRKSEDASSKECCYIWELLALALKEMLSQGLIEEEKLLSFNIPQYTPSPSEVKAEVKNEGSFSIKRLEASEITWTACGNINMDSSTNVAKCMRAVAEPLLVQHFGPLLVLDQLFDKYRTILSDRMSKEETKFVNVTVSMTRLAD